MTTTRASARVFSGSEIKRAIEDAVAAIPDEAEIVEFHAGENMQIVRMYPALVQGTIIGFNTDAWDGERWVTIEWQ